MAVHVYFFFKSNVEGKRDKNEWGIFSTPHMDGHGKKRRVLENAS